MRGCETCTPLQMQVSWYLLSLVGLVDAPRPREMETGSGGRPAGSYGRWWVVGLGGDTVLQHLNPLGLLYEASVDHWE